MALVRSYFKHVWEWDFFRNWDWKTLTREQLGSELTAEIKKNLVAEILSREPRIKSVSVDSVEHDIPIFKEYEEYRRAIEVTVYYYDAHGTTTTYFSVETEAASPVPAWLIPIIEETVYHVLPMIITAIIVYFVYSSLSTVKEFFQYLGEKFPEELKKLIGALPEIAGAGLGVLLVLAILLFMPKKEAKS